MWLKSCLLPKRYHNIEIGLVQDHRLPEIHSHFYTQSTLRFLKHVCLGIITFSSSMTILTTIAYCQESREVSKVASLSTEGILCGDYSLSDIKYQGYGGSGELYRATLKNKNMINLNPKSKLLVAAKLSWPETIKSVQKECETLRYLNQRQVKGVESCLASCSILVDPKGNLESISKSTSSSSSSLVSANTQVKEGTSQGSDSSLLPINTVLPSILSTRQLEESETNKNGMNTMKDSTLVQRQLIILEPFFTSQNPGILPVSTLTDVKSDESRVIAVKQLITTVLQMIFNGVATSDFQPLIDPFSGNTILIDFTEANLFEKQRIKLEERNDRLNIPIVIEMNNQINLKDEEGYDSSNDMISSTNKNDICSLQVTNNDLLMVQNLLNEFLSLVSPQSNANQLYDIIHTVTNQEIEKMTLNYNQCHFEKDGVDIKGAEENRAVQFQKLVTLIHNILD